MLPLIVLETLVSPFKFWNEGIHYGMLYRKDFYERLHQFSTTERGAAYAKAIEAGKGGFKVCVTVSQTHYTVWVEMRSRLEQQTRASADLAGHDLAIA